MITIKNLRHERTKYEWDVKVDRTSILGNPFHMILNRTRDDVCNKYEHYFKIRAASFVPENKCFHDELNKLKKLYATHGKLNLFCWCAPLKCHAETIKSYIKQDEV